MGVVLRDNQQIKPKTADLTNWINKFKTKKIYLKRQKRKDLFIEAVLTYALSRAENELRHKQQLRRQKWQTLKTTWEPINNQDDAKRPVWDIKIYEDLDSLDHFLTEIDQIKIPLQR
ncbi:hypothetical protein QE152_g27768 [Popillia japonica]|uniref:Uncharacterized protein n=1 Tax=Popillia japonica TaxID=7064 RepID=A0AAW1JKW9_POPJA